MKIIASNMLSSNKQKTQHPSTPAKNIVTAVSVEDNSKLSEAAETKISSLELAKTVCQVASMVQQISEREQEVLRRETELSLVESGARHRLEAALKVESEVKKKKHEAALKLEVALKIIYGAAMRELLVNAKENELKRTGDDLRELRWRPHTLQTRLREQETKLEAGKARLRDEQDKLHRMAFRNVLKEIAIAHREERMRQFELETEKALRTAEHKEQAAAAKMSNVRAKEMEVLARQVKLSIKEAVLNHREDELVKREAMLDSKHQRPLSHHKREQDQITARLLVIEEKETCFNLREEELRHQDEALRLREAKLDEKALEASQMQEEVLTKCAELEKQLATRQRALGSEAAALALRELALRQRKAQLEFKATQASRIMEEALARMAQVE